MLKKSIPSAWRRGRGSRLLRVKMQVEWLEVPVAGRVPVLRIYLLVSVTFPGNEECPWKGLWHSVQWSSWCQVVSHWRQCKSFRYRSISRQSQWGMLLLWWLFPHCKKAMVFLRLLERSGATCISTLIPTCPWRCLSLAVGLFVLLKERRSWPCWEQGERWRLLGFSMYLQWPSWIVSCAGPGVGTGEQCGSSLVADWPSLCFWRSLGKVCSSLRGSNIFNIFQF